MHELLVWAVHGTAVVVVLMFVLWLIHLPIRNATIVDVGWSVGLVLLALLYAGHAAGYWRRTAVLVIMVVIWGLRLALHLLLTRLNGQPEDGRYAELRRNWGAHIEVKFLLLFEFQALLCGVLSLPFLLAAHDPSETPAAFEIAGVALWLIALLGEWSADRQLAQFKKDPKNQGRVCDAGLWRYSRHPNYFFEWLIWISFAIVALPAKYGYLGLLSPALILFFLIFVSGIRATEAQALRTKGGAYRKYQQETSPFIPWFPNYK